MLENERKGSPTKRQKRSEWQVNFCCCHRNDILDLDKYYIKMWPIYSCFIACQIGQRKNEKFGFVKHGRWGRSRATDWSSGHQSWCTCKCKLFFTVSASCWWYIFCPDKLLTTNIFWASCTEPGTSVISSQDTILDLNVSFSVCLFSANITPWNTLYDIYFLPTQISY